MWCRKAAPCPPAGPAPAHARAQESTSASCPRHQVVLPGCGRLQSALRIVWEMAAAIRGRNDSRITPPWIGVGVPACHPKGQGANGTRRSHFCRRTSQNPAALGSGTKRGLGSSLRRLDTLSCITPKPQIILLSAEAAAPKPLTGLDDSGLVAGAHRQHLEHPARGPQQLLVVVAAHDLHQGLGSSVGQNNQLRGKGDRVSTSPVRRRPLSHEVGWAASPPQFAPGTKPQHPAPCSHARLQQLERRRREQQAQSSTPRAKLEPLP